MTSDLSHLNLDPLTTWCRQVLEAGQSDAEPVPDPVPLPDHLRLPMRNQGFDTFDEAALAIALSSDLHPGLATSMAYLAGGSRYPTVGLIADLLGKSGTDRVSVHTRLSGSGALSRSGLIQIVPAADVPIVGQPPRGPSSGDLVVPSTAVLRWLFGMTRLDPDLFPHLRDDLVATDQVDPETITALATWFAPGDPVVVSIPSRIAEGIAATVALAAMAGWNVLAVDAVALIERPSAARVAAEALLREAIVIVTGPADQVPSDRWSAFASVVVVGSYPVPPPDSGPRFGVVRIAPGSPHTGGRHLVGLLAKAGVPLDEHDQELLSRWDRLTPFDAHRIAAELRVRAATPSGPPRKIRVDEVSEVAVEIAGVNLATLATPVQTSREWERLVLPPNLELELRELIDQAAHRVEVLDGLGFADLPGQSRGLTAVLAGPSGTGKTLSARLIAGELGLPLYRVDLARVVSKYIGETEKNLDQVFSAAEQTDAVLLFDEAEALFGRRSEVTDARDRYANLEISFLLQRMENYDGVALLSTNLLGHLDDAFSRRMSFILHFPFPNPDQRARIWRAVWPDQVELAADVDVHLLSRHMLAGGHIRNVALAAAHLAASEGCVIDAQVVHRALVREFGKLGLTEDAVLR